MSYLSQFSSDIEALVLGCTHYPLIRESIERIWVNLPHQVSSPETHVPISELQIVDPGDDAAKRFQAWIARKKG